MHFWRACLLWVSWFNHVWHTNFCTNGERVGAELEATQRRHCWWWKASRPYRHHPLSRPLTAPLAPARPVQGAVCHATAAARRQPVLFVRPWAIARAGLQHRLVRQRSEGRRLDNRSRCCCAPPHAVACSCCGPRRQLRNGHHTTHFASAPLTLPPRRGLFLARQLWGGAAAGHVRVDGGRPAGVFAVCQPSHMCRCKQLGAPAALPASSQHAMQCTVCLQHPT